MIQWKPFEFQGILYDLTHLHPKPVVYRQAAGAGKPERECRVFDFRRYALSQYLPSIVEGLHQRKCHHSGKGNFFVVEILTEEGEKVDYEVFFEASRSSKKGVVNLYVQSAYVRDAEHAANRPKRKPINFSVMLFNTLNNKPIKIPT